MKIKAHMSGAILAASIFTAASADAAVTFEIEWAKAGKEISISAENGRVAGITALKGSARVRETAIHVRKADALRLQCRIEDENMNLGPGSTIVSITNGSESFSFFLRDVNSGSPVWIPEYQVTVLPEGDGRSYSQVVESIKAKGIVSKMDRIEASGEASFEEAFRICRSMSAPIWLGISRDMRRFEITEELPDLPSTVQNDKRIVPILSYHPFADPDLSTAPLSYNYSFSRGVGPQDNIRRSLEDGVMPICNSVTDDDGVIYHSKSFVTLERSTLTEENVKGTHYMISDNNSGGRAWTEEHLVQLRKILAETPPADEETILTIHTTITNTAKVPRYAWFKIPYTSFAGGSYEYDPSSGLSTLADGKVFCISTIDGKPVANEEMAVLLGAGKSIEVDYIIPHSPVSRERACAMAMKPYETRFTECKAFWQKKLDAAARIRVPEERVQNMIQAGLLHLDLVTHGDRDQGTLAANVGVYSPIGTESAPIIQFYESMGLMDEARGCLQYFLDTQQEDGRIVNYFGYTIETGAVLWSLGEYWRYTNDRSWAESIKPQLLKACRYLMEWRAGNLREELKGRGYGMVDGKVADPEDQFHQFMLNAYSCMGIKRAAEVLEAIGAAEAYAIRKEAEAWRMDILDSFHASLASSPVVPVSDGSWCPTCSPWAESRTARFLLQKAENYRSHGTFMVPDGLLGPIHLLFAGIVDPKGVEGRMIMKYYRDVICQDNTLFSQPYYGKHNVIQAQLGMVKPFLNTYYNTVAPHFDHETGTFWEHYFKQSVHKTHEEANFLMETRNMLYMECGDTLRMLNVIPRKWMENGKEIELGSVMSYFGPIDFKAVSHVGENRITAEITCDPDRAPSTVTIRLPHPDGKKAKSVDVGVYDSETETVTLSDFKGHAAVELSF